MMNRVNLLGLCTFLVVFLEVTACRARAQCKYVVILFRITIDQPKWQGSWGHHGAHLGPVGPRWAPMLAPWTLLSGRWYLAIRSNSRIFYRQQLTEYAHVMRLLTTTISYHSLESITCNPLSLQAFLIRKSNEKREISDSQWHSGENRVSVGNHYFVSWGQFAEKGPNSILGWAIF